MQTTPTHQELYKMSSVEASTVKLSTPKIPKTTISGTQTSSSMGSVILNCMVCGRCERLLRCSRCKTAVYCSKEHQKLDWKQHKSICSTYSSTTNSAALSTQYAISSQVLDSNKQSEYIDREATNLTNNSNLNEFIYKEPVAGPSVDRFCKYTKSTHSWTSPITSGGILEATIFGATAESLNPTLESQKEAGMPTHEFYAMEDFPQLGISDNKSDDIVIKKLIEAMNADGIHEIEQFAGENLGESVLKEVLDIYSKNYFKEGKLVSNRVGANGTKTIRGDQTAWLYGKEEKYPSIRLLIAKIDGIIMEANKRYPHSKLGEYTINERTKVMVACYPGNGAHYVKHVDNPHGDGRRITAIYYLNKDWDVTKDGGLLRIFPEHCKDKVANITPNFDKIVFFWSDKRNPHEVLPVVKDEKKRYAITVWYYDAEERKKAQQIFQNQPQGVILDREFVKHVLRKTEIMSID